MGPLSVDLRTRVVAAVGEEGMSCRAAAKRFGVSFASAIRWMAALRERGSCAPLAMGGDQRSGRVEAHADYLLGLHRREPDLTLVEICDRLERVRGEKVSPSMIWRFFDRHDITFKKNRRTRANRIVPTSVSGGGNGSKANSTSIRASSCSSTRRARRPTWRDAMAAAAGA
jgi:transposase